MIKGEPSNKISFFGRQHSFKKSQFAVLSSNSKQNGQEKG
jgi:hypothetical protein